MRLWIGDTLQVKALRVLDQAQSGQNHNKQKLRKSLSTRAEKELLWFRIMLATTNDRAAKQKAWQSTPPGLKRSPVSFSLKIATTRHRPRLLVAVRNNDISAAINLISSGY